MGIITKTGDKGTTKTLSGETVSKSDPKIKVVGTFDELVSALGLAKSLTNNQEIADEINELQKDLLKTVSDLSGAKSNITADDVSKIEKQISTLETKTELPKCFVIPGNSPGSASLDLARAIARRMEREAVELYEKNIIKNEQLLIYCNRLSDYLFFLARNCN